MLSCTEAIQECLDFVAGWALVEGLLVQLFPVMVVIVAAVKLARFAGEDG